MPLPNFRLPPRLACLAALAFALLPAVAQAPIDLRIALVIGNSAYPGKAGLPNPVNDARAMTQVLQRLGFQVSSLHDGTQAQMRDAVARLREQLAGKRGVGLFYFAGHGVQHDWRNFVVPVDARLQRVDDIAGSTVDVSEVLEAFKAAGNRLSLVVLDACRDNPFDNTLATKGLAPVDAPPGTYMAFATAPGNVADDGETTNGLYTRHLLQELVRPAARVDDVFQRVKLQVRQASGGRQVPAESTNLDEDFSFDQGFLRPERGSAARLERLQAEKAEWDRVRQSRDPGDFFAFLRLYPNGFMSEIARFRIDQLDKPVLVAQPRRDGAGPLASGNNRFALGDAFTLVVTDRLTGVVRSAPQRVTAASNERVEINGGESVYDQMGGVLRDDSGDKDPPMLMVPADIALGKRWRSVFSNRILEYRVHAAIEFKTVALEDLDLAGTTVRAFRVEFEGFASGIQIKGELWIEPRTMRMVRFDRTVRRNSLVFDSSSLLVTDYRPAPR